MKPSTLIRLGWFGISTILFRRKKAILGTIILTDRCTLHCMHCSVNNLTSVIYPYSAIREEMLLLYLPAAFFFASVAALVGGLSPQEHLPTLVCGLLWLVALLTRSLLRLPGVEYVYPFLRFAGDQHGVWLWSKAALAGIGLLLWAALGLLAEKPPKAGPAFTTPLHKPGKV